MILKTKPLFENFFPTEVKTFFSDRSVDFTLQEGESPFNESQKNYLSTIACISPKNIINIRQVHGKEVLAVSERIKGVPEADGLIINRPGLALAVRTADCIPIFIYDQEKKGSRHIRHCFRRPCHIRFSA